MVSKEGGKCVLTNSESDSEAPPSLALEMKFSLDPSRQVRKRNKALQVRFKDICEAQNEQREAEKQAAGKGGRPVPYKLTHRKYMTVPARRSIPNVTKSTGVQTSPDLKKRYQTFPFERKKGHTVRHTVAVESLRSNNNGFVMEVKGAAATENSREATQCGGKVIHQTQALLHTNECMATVDNVNCSDGPVYPDTTLLSCPDTSEPGAEFLVKPHRALHHGDADSRPSAKRQLLNFEETPSVRPLQDPGLKVTGPIAWNSLTQVECLESPSARSRRKKGLQLNGLQAQSQTLPRAGCSVQARCHSRFNSQTLPAMEERATLGGACRQIVPLPQDGDLKAQLQEMENLISSSQETIKVLLGVIQELEKGEAHREGLFYRTGQDTANCDTCRNSACIIYSVELDFKQQEDKLQPLMKKLCPTDEPQLPSLPYPQEAFASTPKRKSKTESKKHARWKLWFL